MGHPFTSTPRADTTTPGTVPAALQETVSLLHGASGPVESGYVDLLGEQDPLSGDRGRRVFRSRALPRIYERWSRPLTARFVFGMRGPRIEEERGIVLGALQIDPGDRVLDVGCGPGNYSRWFAAAGAGLVVGLDPSPTMLARAVEQGGDRVAYIRGDGAALPFADGTFDAVASIGVLHVMESPVAALEEMTRVLAPGGRLVLGALCGRRKRRRLWWHFFGRDELTDLLADRGLTEVEQRLIGRAQIVSARRGS